MNNFGYNTEDDIMALATPRMESALAIIRASGRSSIDKFCECFSNASVVKSCAGNCVIYGYVLGVDGSKIDQVLVSVFRNPKSYTGEDMVEISAHGSLAGIELILQRLREVGFRDAEAGEFTLRSFLNGKLDLSQAEAVQEIVSSKSSFAHKTALHSLSGAIKNELIGIKDLLMSTFASVELQLDYAEDDLDEEIEVPLDNLDEAEDRLRRLLASYKSGKILKDGIRIALAGKTNSGKSSLFNLLLKEDRSIVSNIHGTTRDYLEAQLSISGLPITLFDTAGLRLSDDPIEIEGIKRTKNIIENCDIIIFVIDNSKEILSEDLEQLKSLDLEKTIVIQNKQDIDSKFTEINSSKLKDLSSPILLSATTGYGFSELENRIKELAGFSLIDTSVSTVISSQRQKNLIQKCLDNLEIAKKEFKDFALDGFAVDLKEALDSIGEITGDITSDDILNSIFGDFCVGK